MFELVEEYKVKLDGCETLCELRRRKDTGDLYANTGAFFERLTSFNHRSYHGRDGRVWRLVDSQPHNTKQPEE